MRQPPQSIDLSCEESADDLGTFDSPCWQRERARFGVAQSQNEPRVSFEVLQLANTLILLCPPCGLHLGRCELRHAFLTSHR